MTRAIDIDPHNDMTVKELCDAAGLKSWDGAVPQPWFDAHREEIRERGGVVWCYDEHVVGKTLFGVPVFYDTLYALVRARRTTEAFIEVLKGMVEQLQGDDLYDFDLQDLVRRMKAVEDARS